MKRSDRERWNIARVCEQFVDKDCRNFIIFHRIFSKNLKITFNLIVTVILNCITINSIIYGWMKVKI